MKHVVSKIPSQKVLIELVSHCDKSEQQDTALHLACRLGYLDSLEALLNALKGDKERIVRDLRNGNDETLLEVAREENHEDCAQYLERILGQPGETTAYCLTF